MAAGFLANGIFLKFSRDDEREADRVGLRMMARAGWDPRGMVELFDILRREAQRNPGSVQVFFSSHPSPAERGGRLRAEVARHRGGRRDSPQFQAIKTRLQRMSPARAMPTS
jgi:predicted Zn-dependent protease